MSKVQQYINHLGKATIAEQERQLLKIIIKNRNTMIDLNTAQLLSGKDSEGQFLQAYRSKAYAEMKLHLNPAGVTDLYLTGAFQQHFYVRASSFPVTIFSSDPKTKELVEKYGPNIFGLAEYSRGVFKNFTSQDVREYYDSVYRLR